MARDMDMGTTALTMKKLLKGKVRFQDLETSLESLNCVSSYLTKICSDQFIPQEKSI